MYRVRGNYSSCICRSSENICSISGGAQEKGKTGSKHVETQFGTKSGAFLSLMYFFAVLVLVSPDFGTNSGFGCCVFLTLWKTLLYSWSGIPWLFIGQNCEDLGDHPLGNNVKAWGTLKPASLKDILSAQPT